jgi:acetyl esterase/lipase
MRCRLAELLVVSLGIVTIAAANADDLPGVHVHAVPPQTLDTCAGNRLYVPPTVNDGAGPGEDGPGISYSPAAPSSLVGTLYLPNWSPAGNPRSAPRPAVVVVHGGNFTSGHRYYIAFDAYDFGACGIVAFSVSYRTASSDPYTEEGDVQAALRWLRANAERFNVNPKKIGAYGAGSGGALAAWLGILDRPLPDLDTSGEHATTSPLANYVIDAFGPNLVLPRVGRLSDAIVNGLDAAAGHPRILFPPTMIVHGGWDGPAYNGAVSPADSWAIARSIYEANMRWWNHAYTGADSRPFPPSLLVYPGGANFGCVDASANMGPWTRESLLPDAAYPTLPTNSCAYQPLSPLAPPTFPRVRSRMITWYMEMTQP